MTPRVLAAAFAVVLLAGVAPAGLARADAKADAEDGFDLLVGTVEASRETAYAGEALWVTYDEQRRAYVRTVTLAANAEGEIALDAPERGRTPAEGLTVGADGWVMPLPVRLDDARAPLATLRRNYTVAVEGDEQIMARPATILAFHRRADGAVRERLWVDDESGLPVRRETYGPDGSLLRLGAFLSLDLAPDGEVLTAGRPLPQRVEGAMPVDPAELQALRKAGWRVPPQLPGGYEMVAAYALEAEGTQPLQVVYADGLYTVSVFQQAGSADWDTLPPGARPVEDLPGEVYEWPGVLPHRLTWSAEGRTWSLVGDAPRDDLRRVASVLPAAEPQGVGDRLRRGFSRLWSAVSEWGSNLLR